MELQLALGFPAYLHGQRQKKQTFITVLIVIFGQRGQTEQPWVYRVFPALQQNFAAKHSSAGVSINLDIRRVTAKEHWRVHVMKITPSSFRRSNILWATRTINLDTNDFNTRTNCVGTSRICRSQVPVAHEFGHAVGNTAVLARGDEYQTSSPHVNDHASIMNIGSQLRDRHFQTIIDELNKMIPGTTFSVRNIR